MKAINSRELGLGGYMSNKEELLEAIEHYDVLTKAQRKVLQTLVQASINNKAVITVSRIAKAAKVSNAAVYQTIEFFKKDRILETLVSSNNKINSFILNEHRLEEVKNIAQCTKNL